MRILHISDLHYGHHNGDLLDNLKTRVGELKPDLILATGDFAHHCDYIRLAEARDYLKELASLCATSVSKETSAPKLLAVPGNHDCAWWGIFPIALDQREYHSLFQGIPTNHFFPDEQVWIYAFNSVTWGWGVRSNGRVTHNDLNAFDKAYSELRTKYAAKFDYSFKIVALHHHPLPLRKKSGGSRWLSLLNGGQFLAEMLSHKIDLIVHGHEHVHAQARFGRGLRISDKQIKVVSVGSVSHSEPGTDRNRFNLICIERNGQVDIETYMGEESSFSTPPVERFPVHTLDDADGKFRETVSPVGHAWESVELETVINVDGDAHRIARLLGLAIAPKSHLSGERRLVLPSTSGYIDLPLVYELNERGQRATEFPNPQRLVKAFSRAGSPKELELVVDCGHGLEPGVRFSMEYDWWAVNAMAMSRTQSKYKYFDERAYEYTHFAVTDPISKLSWTVRFPDGFQLRDVEAHVFQTTDPKSRRRNLEQSLQDCVQTDAQKNLVTLALVKPEIGYSYGFRWTIPDEAPPAAVQFTGQADHLVERLVWFANNFAAAKNSESGAEFRNLLASIARILRNKFAAGPPHELEIGIMVFDRSLMTTVGAIRSQDHTTEWKEHNHSVFEYGEGLGAKAFKSNDIRLYSYIAPPPGRTPNYYIPPSSGGTPYAFLLSIPLTVPEAPQHCYAVINCGSSYKGSPLGKLSGSIVPREQAGKVLAALNVMCYEVLSSIFPHDPFRGAAR